MQLDQEKRGFSFMGDGPLDMRMDQTSGQDACDIVNTWTEKKLVSLFSDFGEERQSRRVANAIVAYRAKKKITTTQELAEIIADAKGGKRGKKHPATLVFQALRLAVNKEMESIKEGIKKAIHVLAPKGRIGAISFHSIEDRLVKNLLRDASKPIRKIEGSKETCYKPMLKLLTKKPIVPSLQEIKLNARARSAKMRFAEKIGS